MITLETLEKWLVEPVETEHLEFKEAKNQFDTTKLMRYCVAISNEGGGSLVVTVPEVYATITVSASLRVDGNRDGADNPNRLVKQASVR